MLWRSKHTTHHGIPSISPLTSLTQRRPMRTTLTASATTAAMDERRSEASTTNSCPQLPITPDRHLCEGVAIHYTTIDYRAPAFSHLLYSKSTIIRSLYLPSTSTCGQVRELDINTHTNSKSSLMCSRRERNRTYRTWLPDKTQIHTAKGWSKVSFSPERRNNCKTKARRERNHG
jgi:hypothetical protein